jgi:hypothetical protein
MRGKANRNAPHVDHVGCVVVSVFRHLQGLRISFHLAYPRHLTLASAELLQNFTPDRVPRLSDAMEKLFGGAAGLALGAISESCFMPRAVYG